MERKPLPIGIEDFKEVIDSGYYFVDKTLMIKDLIVNKVKVGLFTRPRRFGKTLNMSMIQRFFEKTDESNAYLFDRLKISEYPECMQYQGQSPVISISLKSMKQGSYKDAFHMFKVLIAREYDRHKVILKSGKISDSERDLFHSILTQRAEDAFYLDSIKFLSDIMVKYYNKNVIILIDEYDVPLEKAHENGYYHEMVLLLRNLFGNVLKTNRSLAFAVLTGCLRIAKESIFTGLNNFKVYSITNMEFDETFGFTDAEVREMLQYYELIDKYEEVKEWYDGYRFGNTEVYCPWDVVNYCSDHVKYPNAAPENYWMNTSGNNVMNRFIDSVQQPDMLTKAELGWLVNGETVVKKIDETVTYDDLYSTMDHLWSTLFMTGYLTQKGKEVDGRYCLAIPNQEIKNIVTERILTLFRNDVRKDGRAVL